MAILRKMLQDKYHIRGKYWFQGNLFLTFLALLRDTHTSLGVIESVGAKLDLSQTKSGPKIPAADLEAFLGQWTPLRLYVT